MQREVECARRGLTAVRRFYWFKGAAMETREEMNVDDEYLQRVLRTWDAGTWKAVVLQIAGASQTPVVNPTPYAFLLNEMSMNSDWLATGEHNSDGVFHVHALARNPQRTDAWIRSANAKWFTVRAAAIDDVGDADPLLTIMKCQTAHKPSSLLCYMVKNPEWLIANSEANLRIISGVHLRDMGDRFRPENTRRFKLDANRMTEDLIGIITDHGCKSAQDVFSAAPDIIVQYLHRPGFGAVLQNCLAWVHATRGGWSLTNIHKKHSPDPTNIHRVLLHQGILPTDFDSLFYKWLTKSEEKRNTLVLWGPSNTGKSAFIRGFKEAAPWGEIVNSNQFAFEALTEAMFGIWEEPLISAEQAEKCKQIFEGMECSIPIKYKKPHKLPRTPILMTTNHAPWRYCSSEEPMFRNRMWILPWECDATTVFTCRVSEHSCQCTVCQTSRGGETAVDGESASSVSGGEQPILGMASGSGSIAGDVSAGSMCSTSAGSRGCDASLSGSNSLLSTRAAIIIDEQRAVRARSSGSPSAAARNGIRSRRAYGPSNRRKRVCGSQSGNSELVVSNKSRKCDGRDLERDGVGQTGGADASGCDSDPGRSGGECSSGSSMVVLGETQDPCTSAKVSSSQSELGGSLGSLVIPTRANWLSYLSFLQNKHGN
ncbi:nonstructural protein 1 [Pangolin chaphamaparvovirus]|nr:nonstructural protein 1 [Pangolin chaphamaparvovirus]